MPFPFRDIYDPEFVGILDMDERGVTELFAERTGGGSALVSSVLEYTAFRKGYEDGGLPESSFDAPLVAETSTYEAALIGQLDILFGRSASFTRRAGRPGSSTFARIDLQIAEPGIPAFHDPGDVDPDTSPQARFNASAQIRFDAERSEVSITKPLIKAAWTFEQAFADARAITDVIMRSADGP